MRAFSVCIVSASISGRAHMYCTHTHTHIAITTCTKAKRRRAAAAYADTQLSPSRRHRRRRTPASRCSTWRNWRAGDSIRTAGGCAFWWEPAPPRPRSSAEAAPFCGPYCLSKMKKKNCLNHFSLFISSLTMLQIIALYQQQHIFCAEFYIYGAFILLTGKTWMPWRQTRSGWMQPEFPLR